MTEMHEEVKEAIAWLEASIARDEAELAEMDRNMPEIKRFASRFYHNDPSTIAYWRDEVKYWTERMREHKLNGEDDPRSARAIRLATQQIKEMIRVNR